MVSNKLEDNVKKKKEAYESYVYRKAGMVECTAWMGVSLPMHFKRYDKQAKPKKKYKISQMKVKS